MEREQQTKAANRKDPLWTPLNPEQLRAARAAPDLKEISRRQNVVARILELRDSLSPLQVDPTELLRQAREEDDARPDR